MAAIKKTKTYSSYERVINIGVVLPHTTQFHCSWAKWSIGTGNKNAKIPAFFFPHLLCSNEHGGLENLLTIILFLHILCFQTWAHFTIVLLHLFLNQDLL